MTDYISREDALNFEMEIEADPEEIQAISKGMALYGEYIKSIPAADVVERKKGCWYTHSTIFRTTLRCTNCQKPSDYQFNYCPNCGARMKARASDDGN